MKKDYTITLTYDERVTILVETQDSLEIIKNELQDVTLTTSSKRYLENLYETIVNIRKKLT